MRFDMLCCNTTYVFVCFVIALCCAVLCCYVWVSCCDLVLQCVLVLYIALFSFPAIARSNLRSVSLKSWLPRFLAPISALSLVRLWKGRQREDLETRVREGVREGVREYVNTTCVGECVRECVRECMSDLVSKFVREGVHV